MNLKKIIILILTVALLATAAYGFTLAFFSDTDEVHNTITLGSVKTEIYEEGSGTTKISYIKNVGSSPCFVRARVVISPAEAASYITLKDTEGTNWIWPNDWSEGNYVKYGIPLQKGEDTDPLFTGITITDANVADLRAAGITSFDIMVYEESVQTIVYKDDGSKITDRDAIWAWYDNGGKESNTQAGVDSVSP